MKVHDRLSVAGQRARTQEYRRAHRDHDAAGHGGARRRPADAQYGALTDDDALDGLIDRTSWREAKANFERIYLMRKLSENGGNVSRTAEAIGVERTHLHRRIKALGIETDQINQRE
ncbi:MAG: hypothetical protein M5R36_06240 [Deltaproteobacteria bacterium]|nr:hypothetical protein [Deltaproteobacteria bacterium]